MLKFSPTLRRLGVAAMIFPVLVLAGSGPASAAPGDPALGLSITTATTSVPAGGNATWTVNWSCSGVTGACNDAVLTVPIPVSAPDAITPNNCHVVGDAAGNTTSAVVTDANEAVWTFKTPLPAGTSGQLTLNCTTRNGVTPDGSTYTPSGRFTASNAAPASTVGAPVTVTAVAKVALRKSKLSASRSEPFLNTPVTYGLQANDAVMGGQGYGELGVANLRDYVMTDTLPATARYSSSSNGGVLTGADGSGLGGTVTWPVFTGSDGGIPNNLVTMVYPSPPNSGDSNPQTTGDNVTNTASVSAHPYLRPNAAPLTATAAVTHGFQTPGSGSPSFDITKTVGGDTHQSSNMQRGSSAAFQVRGANMGNVVVDFSYTDHLPCTLTSPWDGSTCTAAKLGVLGNGLTVFNDTQYPAASVLHTTANQTYTLITASRSGRTQPDLRLAPGEYIDSYTVSGKADPGDGIMSSLSGVINSAVPASSVGVTYRDSASQSPAGASPGDVVVENCLNAAGGDITVTVDGTGEVIAQPFIAAQHCAEVVVVASYPSWMNWLSATDGSKFPGGTIKWKADVSRMDSGSQAASPVLTNLLPANLTYVPGSLTPGAGVPTPTVEVLADYHGTGRTLLRASWPGQKFVQYGSAQVSFDTTVIAGTAPASYQNETAIFDSIYTTDSNMGFCATWNGGADTDDLNGDGSVTDLRCLASASYTVTRSAAAAVIMTAKGSVDSGFVAAPGIGRTVPGTPSEYQIQVLNQGNVPLQNMVAYEILPFVGDTGVSGSQATSLRGSQWQPVLDRGVSQSGGTTVEYSQSSNPCRGEVFTVGGSTASAPTGCVNDWTSAAPSPWSAVRALRLVVTGPVAGGDGGTFGLMVNSPLDSSGVAWNTAAVAAQRADDGSFLLPTETAKVGLESAILTISKAVVGAAVDNGDGTQTATYRIQVANAGESAVPYTLADSFQFGGGINVLSSSVSNTAPGTITTIPGWNGSSSTTIVTNQSLAGHTTDTYTVLARVQTTAPITADAVDCSWYSGERGTGLNNTATLLYGPYNAGAVACTPALLGGLQIDKTVDKTTALHGDTLTYTVTVSNIGGLAATDVPAVDTLPKGVTFASATGGGTVNGQSVIWTIPTLAVGATSTFKVTATVNPGVDPLTLVNTFGITNPANFPSHKTWHACTSDATLSCARTTVAGVGKIGIDKTVDKSAAVRGDTLTYTMTVTNIGGLDVLAVEAVDTFPAGLSFVSASGGGIWNGRSVRWTIPVLAIGAKTALTVVATVNGDAAADSLTNTFEATSPSIFGSQRVSSQCADVPTASCATTTVTKAPLVPGLTLNKQVLSAPGSDSWAGGNGHNDQVGRYTTGDTVTWRLTVTNTSAVPLSNVVLSDPLAAGCNKTFPTLLARASTTVTCTSIAVASMINTAAVAATGVPGVTSSAAITVTPITPIAVIHGFLAWTGADSRTELTYATLLLATGLLLVLAGRRRKTGSPD